METTMDYSDSQDAINPLVLRLMERCGELDRLVGALSAGLLSLQLRLKLCTCDSADPRSLHLYMQTTDDETKTREVAISCASLTHQGGPVAFTMADPSIVPQPRACRAGEPPQYVPVLVAPPMSNPETPPGTRTPPVPAPELRGVLGLVDNLALTTDEEEEEEEDEETPYPITVSDPNP